MGGITDNLGLRALYEIVEMVGGAGQYANKMESRPPSRMVVISVNASTSPESTMDQTHKQPSLEETINAMSDVQLHHYNVATLELVGFALKRWAKELSTPEKEVQPYFIRVDLQDVKQPELKQFLNQVSTSFKLTDEQVDRLIETGGQLLRDSP